MLALSLQSGGVLGRRSRWSRSLQRMTQLYFRQRAIRPAERWLSTTDSEDEHLTDILENNKRWVASKVAQDPNYFGGNEQCSITELI